jgi:hypothetical protein
MKYEIVNHEVLTVEEIKGETKLHIVRKHFDREFHTKLKIDKINILADGIDQATITAEVYNYLDEAQTDWTGDIVFEVDGIEEIVSTTNGVASTTFDSQVTGEFTIKTIVPKFRNGEQKVVAE